MIQIVLSGGQTGVDQAALRAAQAANRLCAGWCPPDQSCETGTIPSRFPLQPTPLERSEGALDVPRSQRTEWNVLDSDGTLVIRLINADKEPKPDPGTDWTKNAAEKHDKHPYEVWVWAVSGEKDKINMVDAWCRQHKIRVFDVGGTSEIGSKVDEEIKRVAAWVGKYNIRVLNVGGPSEKTLPGVGDWTYRFLTKLFNRRPA
jgi:hypothetical protein